MNIESIEVLRGLYPPPKERSVRKQLSHLDAHCRRYISLSPLLVLASCGNSGLMDASPRGGAPGFVKMLSDKTLLIPDAPGNNRLDSLENILAVPSVGLLFFIPGVDETLRINGLANLSTAPEYLGLFSKERRLPTLVIRVQVEEAYLHCAKALMRSKLWEQEAKVDRSVLPTMGQMVHDQAGITAAPETQEAMLLRYAADL